MQRSKDDKTLLLELTWKETESLRKLLHRARSLAEFHNDRESSDQALAWLTIFRPDTERWPLTYEQAAQLVKKSIED